MCQVSSPQETIYVVDMYLDKEVFGALWDLEDDDDRCKLALYTAADGTKYKNLCDANGTIVPGIVDSDIAMIGTIERHKQHGWILREPMKQKGVGDEASEIHVAPEVALVGVRQLVCEGKLLFDGAVMQKISNDGTVDPDKLFVWLRNTSNTKWQTFSHPHVPPPPPPPPEPVKPHATTMSEGGTLATRPRLSEGLLQRRQDAMSANPRTERAPRRQRTMIALGDDW